MPSKRQLLWDTNGSVFGSKSVLGEAASRRTDFVQGSNTISLPELGDVLSHALDYTSNIIAAVGNHVLRLWKLPILRVDATNRNFDEDLVGRWLGDIDVEDLDNGSCEHEKSPIDTCAQMNRILPLATRASFILNDRRW